MVSRRPVSKKKRRRIDRATMRTIAATLSLVLFTGCGAKEPNLVGRWKSSRSEFRITKEGDGYTVVVSNPNGMLGGVYKGPYRDGAIRVSGPLAPICPDVKYSRDSDHLMFCGEEFVRTGP
jgi:hypothetical protein